MTFFRMCGAAAVFSVVATAAFPAVVKIESVTGAWVGTSDNNAYGVSINNTESKAEVFWGKGPEGGPQSSYSFERSIPPSLIANPDEEFELGVFTHNNKPIYTDPGNGQDTAIDWADLEVTFDILIDDTEYFVKRSYRFEHAETRNDGVDGTGNCEFGGRDGDAGVNEAGCADRVFAALNEAGSEVVEVDGVTYTFDITGFLVGDEEFDFFHTREKKSNEAILLASYSVSGEPDPAPPPSPVPLPAAGWMLIAGVGGLAAMKRRKRRANT